MKKSRNSMKLFIFIISVVIICLMIVLIYCFKRNQIINVNYSDFIWQLESNNIEMVKIKEDKIVYKCINNDTQYCTDNPKYDSFREELLLKNIKIYDSKSNDILITNLFDILISLIIIALIGFGIYKCIQFRHSSFKIIHKTDKSFQDIAGMNALKNDMMTLVELMKNQKVYTNIRPIKGIIFEGPPGNGKTLFAKALATEAGMNFIATKGADFQSAFMSVGPLKIKMLFKIAYKHKPCIIFIDEFDGVGEKRNYAGQGIDKENNRLIINLLNEMDGFESNNGIIVIAATNSFSCLDPALIRPGRFDRKYLITNPDEKTRRELLELYRKDLKFDSQDTEEYLIRKSNGFSCSAIETLINELQISALNSPMNVTVSLINDIINRMKI